MKLIHKLISHCMYELYPSSKDPKQLVQGFGIGLVDLAGVSVPEQSDLLHYVISPGLELPVGAEIDGVSDTPQPDFDASPEGDDLGVCDLSWSLEDAKKMGHSHGCVSLILARILFSSSVRCPL